MCGGVPTLTARITGCENVADAANKRTGSSKIFVFKKRGIKMTAQNKEKKFSSLKEIFRK
jgi:hypothetical protein